MSVTNDKRRLEALLDRQKQLDAMLAAEKLRLAKHKQRDDRKLFAVVGRDHLTRVANGAYSILDPHPPVGLLPALMEFPGDRWTRDWGFQQHPHDQADGFYE
jgi:hypothetical protein